MFVFFLLFFNPLFSCSSSITSSSIFIFFSSSFSHLPPSFLPSLLQNPPPPTSPQPSLFHLLPTQKLKKENSNSSPSPSLAPRLMGLSSMGANSISQRARKFKGRTHMDGGDEEEGIKNEFWHLVSFFRGGRGGGFGRGKEGM